MTSSLLDSAATLSSHPCETATRLSGFKVATSSGVCGSADASTATRCGVGVVLLAMPAAQCSEVWAWASSAAHRSPCTNMNIFRCTAEFIQHVFGRGGCLLVCNAARWSFLPTVCDGPTVPRQDDVHRKTQRNQRLRKNHAGGCPGLQQPQSAELDVSTDGAVGTRSGVRIARRST